MSRSHKLSLILRLLLPAVLLSLIVASSPASAASEVPRSTDDAQARCALFAYDRGSTESRANLCSYDPTLFTAAIAGAHTFSGYCVDFRVLAGSGNLERDSSSGNGCHAWVGPVTSPLGDIPAGYVLAINDLERAAGFFQSGTIRPGTAFLNYPYSISGPCWGFGSGTTGLPNLSCTGDFYPDLGHIVSYEGLRTDLDPGTFDWPDYYPGATPPPTTACGGLGVEWDPLALTELVPGDRQSVTVTVPAGYSFDDVELSLNWEWGQTRTGSNWTYGYRPPDEVTNLSADERLLSLIADDVGDNYAFNLRCVEVEGGATIFYRRVNGDASTAENEIARPCFYLVVRFPSDSTASFPTATVQYRTNGPIDQADAGGITALSYARFPVGFDPAVTLSTATWSPSSPLPITSSISTFVQASYDFTGTGAEEGSASAWVDCVDNVGTLRIFPPPSGSGGDSSGGVNPDPDADPIEVPVPPGVGGDGDPTGGPGGPGPAGVGTGPGDGNTCFEIAGWSLTNPVSWVTGGIRVAGCYARALIVPDPDVIDTAISDAHDDLSEQFPFSAGFRLVEFGNDTVTGISYGGCLELGITVEGVDTDCVDPGENVVLTPSQRSVLVAIVIGSLAVTLYLMSFRLVIQ